MKTDANVVPLTKATAEQSPTSPVGRLPVALIQVRDKAAQQLKQNLQSLFDNADDTLFEMADRATSNAEQNAFFEAMRDLRLKRKSIERGFLQKVFESFANLNQYEIGKPQPALDAVSFDSLSLVQNDELEETVALDAMVAKVMSRDAVALGHLTTRLNAVISKKLDDKSNPLGPTLLSEYFLDACSSLGVEIKVKLIILKLFEKYVLGSCDMLYAEANQALVSAGVLPELKSAPPRRQQRPAASTYVQSSGEEGISLLEGADQGVQEVFGALQDLLLQVRGTAMPRRAQVADALPITSNDLMRLLSHMQQRAPAQASVEDFDLRDQLERLLERASAKSGKARVVGEVDEDVINLVSMLFEFILDDRTLPDSLKALIGRLQIPMLKVAVLDKTFFSRGSHPARRLLNEIASAALGWVDQDDAQRDGLYQKIEQVVQRLLNDFVDDPAIFSELLADFMAFTGDERRRSELLEQRTRDAEEGSAKAELARRQVEHALNERLLGKTLPEVVVRLLQEAWSKVLMLICLKHGVDSEEWQAALQTMDDLVWSVAPHEDPEARLRLLELVPGLLKALREGMASAAFDPFSTSEFFSQLEGLHVQAFQRFKRAAPEAETAVAEDAAHTDPSEAGIELPLLELPAAEEIEDAPAMVEVVEEIILLAPGQTRPQEPDVVLPDDDEALLQVDSLRVGSWVEIQEDEEHKLRCKLAAIIKPTGKYVFVNRTGMKVLEKTRNALAVEFRRNAVRLLDDALLFDRALESVIGNLRKLKHS
ncbi:DUF1631 domain-containing protein [Pseudomonas sp. GD03721]|nr:MULTISPECIES: DUF1631 domain-containing protein [unclassified Pseudomonas]MDH1444170.1 DUF1631 domain-containing protein [Pseudomonas sp. GD03722]WGG02472.1 DUF1631 domain-containing protein [Pseudomonas sp. GD03721]WGG06641.1 DUF1631 domain-containing protein [Pseudomonas sp. GD03919]